MGVCTGTVVAPRLVLTAGHCAVNRETGVVNEASGYRVVTGNVNWMASPKQVSGVSKVIPYPSYAIAGPLENWGDAALLVLETPTTVPAIPLAGVAETELWRPGKAGFMVGWGRTSYEQTTPTEVLHEAPTAVQSPKWCASHASGFHPIGQLCTIYPPTFATGTCQGDSGGPLLALRSQSELVEIGILSGGYNDCSTTQPSVYTRISLVVSWIDGWIEALNALPSGQTAPPSLEGVYRGNTNKGKPIALVVGAGGGRITALSASFVYRCRNGHTLNEPLEGLSNRESERLSTSHSFDGTFNGNPSATVAGTFNPQNGTVDGTVTGVYKTHRYGRCSTGRITWSAQREATMAPTAAVATPGSYSGWVNGTTRMGVTVGASGHELVGLHFSAVYRCPHGRHMRSTESFLSPSDTQALESFGTFTTYVAGPHHYTGRMDGVFGLTPGSAFGTLEASTGSRYGRCSTGLLDWRADRARVRGHRSGV